MFRVIGTLLATGAVLIFLYGAMQFARAQQGGGPRIDMGDGTFGQLESPARAAGNRALILSGVLLAGAVGVVVFDQSRRARRRGARAR